MILKLKNQRLINATTPFTQTTAQMDSADTTINVLSDDNFTGSNKYILFGNFGDESSEIVAFTSATGNVLTVAAVSKDHPAGTPVYLLNANQVQFMYSATVSGTYAELTKVNIDAESLVTTYEDSSNSAGFGKARFWNSGSSEAYQDFWEIIKYDGDDRKTRGYAKKVAMARQNVPDGDPDITEEFLNDAITECDERIRAEKINWKEEVAELTISTSLGVSEYDISSYFKEQLTVSSLLYVKCDGEKVAVRTYDNFLANQLTAVKTYLASDVATTDTEITVDDSSDLPDEGSILIGSDSIDYTANDRDTNVLSGVTNISTTHSTDDEVWYDATFGVPDAVSVMNGTLHVYPIINAEKYAKNITIVYSKDYTNITLDSDALAFPSYLYISFLRAAIAEKKGQKDSQVLRQSFDIELAKHKSKDVSPTEVGFRPSTPIYSSSRRGSLK